MIDPLSLLRIYYLKNFCSVNYWGQVEEPKELIWTPYHTEQALGLLKDQSFTVRKLVIQFFERPPIDLIDLKLAICACFHRSGHNVTWNFKLGRNTLVDLYVESIDIGFHVARLEDHSSKETMHYTLRRVKTLYRSNRLGLVRRPTIHVVHYLPKEQLQLLGFNLKNYRVKSLINVACLAGEINENIQDKYSNEERQKRKNSLYRGKYFRI